MLRRRRACRMAGRAALARCVRQTCRCRAKGTNAAVASTTLRSVTQDHRPGAVFDELLRLGFIREDGRARSIALTVPSFQQSFADRVLPLAENLEDHATAAVTNVLSEAPPFLSAGFLR